MHLPNQERDQSETNDSQDDNGRHKRGTFAELL
jgi:hypothetical protein